MLKTFALPMAKPSFSPNAVSPDHCGQGGGVRITSSPRAGSHVLNAGSLDTNLAAPLALAAVISGRMQGTKSSFEGPKSRFYLGSTQSNRNWILFPYLVSVDVIVIHKSYTKQDKPHITSK